ncbi:MAG: 50S ribosomal protein L6 [Candidatus Kerfeldbacteria bacterium]|nr:50S ribosomal protein L6 [Candidatus Kerfeldbacteria bacterium]
MSRIGKKQIPIPDGVTVAVHDGIVTVKGPKGELTERLHPHVSVHVTDGVASVTVVQPDLKSDRALWGLFRALLANMVRGVTEGFTKRLEVHGVGYKLALSGQKLVLHVGYSHPVEFQLPDGISGKVEKNALTLTGANKQVLGDVAARIRSVRPPEPYKGKGIRYSDETVRRKAGKVVKSAE